MPLAGAVPGVEHGVLQRAAVAVWHVAAAEAVEVEQALEALQVGGQDDAFMVGAQLALVAVALVPIPRALHARARDEGVGAGVELDGEVVGVHDLGDLRQRAVFLGRRVAQHVGVFPGLVALLDEEGHHLAQQAEGAVHLLEGLALHELQAAARLCDVDAQMIDAAQYLFFVLALEQALAGHDAAQQRAVWEVDGDGKIA